MSRQRILITAVVAVVAFLSGCWFMQQGTGQNESVYQRARLFDDVLTHVADYYVDSLDQRQLYRMAIDGMLAELRDLETGLDLPDEVPDMEGSPCWNADGTAFYYTRVDEHRRPLQVLRHRVGTDASRPDLSRSTTTSET